MSGPYRTAEYKEPIDGKPLKKTKAEKIQDAVNEHAEMLKNLDKIFNWAGEGYGIEYHKKKISEFLSLKLTRVIEEVQREEEVEKRTNAIRLTGRYYD